MSPGSLNMEPPPKTPSILPTLRPLFSPFFLMYAQSALVIARRLALPLMPVTFARAADCVTGLKRPTALFLPAALFFLLFGACFTRWPPGYRSFFAFFFLRFFFFFFAFFFFFFFLAFGFLAFLAFFALGFFAAFFAGFFFFAAH